MMIEISIVGLRPTFWYIGTKIREPAQEKTKVLALVVFLISVDCPYPIRREDLDYSPAATSDWVFYRTAERGR